LGSLRITKKNNKYVAQIAITPNLPEAKNTHIVMGVDLGILCPAVAATSNGKIQFFGKGRERKYKRRHFQKKRKKLQRKKKLKKVKHLGQKEQRWMNDQDNKLSRQIVNYAINNNVDTIKLEYLGNIRNSTRTSRKNKYIKYRNDTLIDNWSFYRLTQYIIYKARLAGIKVIFINPANTSKACPRCGKLNTTNNRHYECECGYKTHRDIVGAYNIMQAN
jgi:IS605 OrfB family transposase